MEKKVIFAQQGKLEVDSNNITDIVIFPVGHHDVVVGGPDGNPLPLSVDIDEFTFNVVKANTLTIHKDFGKMWSDFSHSGGTVTSYLQDLIWDATRGIVARVKLTTAGLAAVTNNILNYFSPSFKIDPFTNEILSLCANFGACTDQPAFTALREYPITAMDQSNIYYKNLKRNKPMEIVAEKAITVDVIKPVEEIKLEASKPVIQPKTDETSPETDEDDVTKAKKKLAEAEAKVKKAEAYAEADAKKSALDAEVAAKIKTETEALTAVNPDEADDIKLFDSKFIELFTKYLPDIKKLLTTAEAMVTANNPIKDLEDKITAINVEQCKIQDALKSVNKEEKEKILRATQPINNFDMPGVKTNEVIVQAEIASGMRQSPDQLYKIALKLQKDSNVSFQRAWQQAKQI